MLITASAISSWQSRFANCRMASKWSTLQIFKMDSASVHPMRTIFANREAVSPYVLGCSESCQSSSSLVSSFSFVALGGTPLGALCTANEFLRALMLVLLSAEYYSRRTKTRAWSTSPRRPPMPSLFAFIFSFSFCSYCETIYILHYYNVRTVRDYKGAKRNKK